MNGLYPAAVRGAIVLVVAVLVGVREAQRAHVEAVGKPEGRKLHFMSTLILGALHIRCDYTYMLYVERGRVFVSFKDSHDKLLLIGTYSIVRYMHDMFV